MTRRRRKKKKEKSQRAWQSITFAQNLKQTEGSTQTHKEKKQPLTVRYYYPSDEKALAYVDSGSTTTTSIV
jgi:hypothetical protein